MPKHLWRNLKESSLRIGGFPLPISFLIIATRFFGTQLQKGLIYLCIKKFRQSSYIFGIITFFLADKLFLIWQSNTLLNTTPEGWMIFNIAHYRSEILFLYQKCQKSFKNLNVWYMFFMYLLYVNMYIVDIERVHVFFWFCYKIATHLKCSTFKWTFKRNS